MLAKEAEINDMSELRLGGSNIPKKGPENPLLLHIADKEDPRRECWAELKVKDRFINKRSYHAATIYKSKLFVYGGQDLNVGIYSDFNYISLNEDLILSCWDPVNVNGKSSPGPLSRMMSVLDDDKWYLFGGTSSAVQNLSTLWCFDFIELEWSQLKSTNNLSPPPLDSHAGCIYAKNANEKYIVSFGGFVGGSYGEYWNQIVKYDINKKQWILPYNNIKSIDFVNPSAPSPRCGHSVSLHKDNMYVFAGTNGEYRFNDLWICDLTAESWKKINPKESPPLRNGHTSVLYKDKGFIVFGGIQDITHEKDDLLFFEFATNNWKTLDTEYDHSKVSSFRNDKSPEPPIKSEKHVRQKSLADSPTKRQTSRLNSRFLDPSSPTKQNYSPTMSAKDTGMNKHSRLQTNTSFGVSQSEFRTSGSPGGRPYQGLSKENEEKKKKLFMARKQNFLKEFEVTNPEDISNLILKSPTTEAMKNSIIAINYKGTTENETSVSLSPTKLKKKATTSNFNNLLGDNSIRVKIPVNGKLTGRKPCARDGHSACVYADKMIVFGGDRHKMSFNDIYSLNMSQILNSHDKEAY